MALRDFYHRCFCLKRALSALSLKDYLHTKELQTDFELYTDTSFGEQANIGVFNA